MNPIQIALRVGLPALGATLAALPVHAQEAAQTLDDRINEVVGRFTTPALAGLSTSSAARSARTGLARRRPPQDHRQP